MQQQQQEVQLIDERIGNFHVVELLGRGAMASVYRAFDTELERDVALKVPDPHFAVRVEWGAGDKTSFARPRGTGGALFHGPRPLSKP